MVKGGVVEASETGFASNLAFISANSFSSAATRGSPGVGAGVGAGVGLGWGRGHAWACLHVTRSSEHEYGEFRQARTGLQECNGFVVLGIIASLILCAYHCIVQHGAAILSSVCERGWKGRVWITQMQATQQASSPRPCRRWRPGPSRARF